MLETNLRRRVAHIESLIAHGQLNRAQSQAEELLTDFPHFWRGTRLMAQVALQRGTLAVAQLLFERVLAIVPEDGLSHRALVAIHEQQGDNERVLLHALCSFEQHPDERERREQLRQSYQRVQGRPLGRLPMSDAARGYLALERDKPGAALPAFRQALIEAPARLDLHSSFIMAAWLASRPTLAYEAAQALAHRLPKALVAALILGQHHLEAGELAAAHRHLRLAIQLEPTHELATHLFGGPLPLPPLEREGRPVRAAASPPPPAPGRTSGRPMPPVGRAIRRPRPPETMRDGTPSWVLYLLGRTRAELTRLSRVQDGPPAPAPNGQHNARAAPTTAPPSAREAQSASEDEAGQRGAESPAERLAHYESGLKLPQADREAILVEMRDWAEADDAPAALYELLGDLAREDGDLPLAARRYRQGYERL